MTPDKMQALSSMNTRQKAIAGITVLIVLIIIWQLFGLFSSKSSSQELPNTNPAANVKAAGPGGVPGGAMPSQITPKPAEVPQTMPMSDREMQLLKLQQDTQAKYLEALNELQILKLNRDIAVTNKDISSANLARVESDKKIVEMLAPPAPPPVSVAITKPIGSVSGQEAGTDANPAYTVVSVSQIQYRWSAVLSYKGSLFNVHVGDVLPADGSTVSAINKDSVTLEKEGVKRKLSLVPII